MFNLNNYTIYLGFCRGKFFIPIPYEFLEDRLAQVRYDPRYYVVLHGTSAVAYWDQPNNKYNLKAPYYDLMYLDDTLGSYLIMNFQSFYSKLNNK